MNHQDLIKNMLPETGPVSLDNLDKIKDFIDSYLPKYSSEMENIKDIFKSGDITPDSILTIDKSLMEKFDEEVGNSFAKAYSEGTSSAEQYLIEFYDWLNKKVKDQELIDVEKIDKELEEVQNKYDNTKYRNSNSVFIQEMASHTGRSDWSSVDNLLNQYSSYEEFKNAANTTGIQLYESGKNYSLNDFEATELESIKQYYEDINSLESEINTLTEERIDAEKRNNTLLDEKNKTLQRTIELNDIIINQELSTGDKTAKKARKTITSAEKEYEKNGYLSPETLKELIALGDKYKDAWINSNGEIEFHSDKLKEIELNDIDIAKAKAYENIQLSTQTYWIEKINGATQERLDKIQEEIDKYKEEYEYLGLIYEAAEKANEEAEEVTEAGYYKQKEYEAPKRSTQYIDDEIKRKQEELDYLKEEAEYLSGDSLTKNLEEQKRLKEEIIALDQEQIDYNKETINQNDTILEQYAKEHGFAIEKDASGYYTRETQEKFLNATEAEKRAALERENAAGVAKEANTDKDSKKGLENAYKQAQEANEQATKEASRVMDALDARQKANDAIADTTRKLPNEQREAELIDATKYYVKLEDIVKNINKEYKIQDAQLQKIKEDFDSLSPEEQGKKLQEMKALKDKQKEETKQELQAYEQALKEGLQGVDLGDIDISNLASKSSAEIEVMKEELEDLARAAHERGDIVSEEKIKAAIDQIDGVTEAAKRNEEQLKKNKVSWEETFKAQNAAALEKVNNALSETEKQLKRIKSAQSGLKGKDLINNLKQQQALLQKQVALEKQKLAISAQYASQMIGITQARLNDINLGIQIKQNQDGTLANYNAILVALYERNDLDKEDVEYYKKLLDLSNEFANKQAEAQSKIEDLQSQVTSISKEIADKIKEETKNALKKALERFNAKVDVEIDIEDAWRQLHKLKAELDGLRDDDYFKNINVQAKQFSEYLKTNPNSLLPGGSTQILTDHLNQIMSEINIIQGGGTSSIYGKGAEAEKQAFEDLKKYRDELASNVESGLSAIKEMKQTYLSTIDAFISKNQEFMQTLEKINDISQKVIDTMKLVYGDAAIKYIDKYLKAQTQGNQKLLEVAKQKAALAENKMKDALARGDQDAYQKWASAYKTYSDEVWKYIQETIKSAQAEFENLFEVLKQEAIQAYKDVYAETSALPLDMRWDLEGERDKEFKDYTDSLYEVGTLTRKVNESINNADTVAAREKLSKFLQEDVGYLNTQIDKEKQLSKYEIERANAKYELTLRQIALEEAQNNKSKMRLRRDSQGNYRYEYVADQDKINDATQKVEDAMNKLYNLDKEYARKYSQMLSSLQTEFYDKLNEIYERQWDTDEERDAAIQALKEEYYGEYGLITQIYKQGVYARDNLLQTSADKESALIKNVEDTLKKSYQEMQAEVEVNLTKIDEKWHQSQEVIASAQGTVEGLNQTWEEHSAILEGISEQENTLVENLNAQLAAIEALLPEIEAMAEAWKQVAEQALAANEASLLLRETLKEEEEEAKKANENAATNTGAGAGVNTSSGGREHATSHATVYFTDGKKTWREFVKDDNSKGNLTVGSSGVRSNGQGGLTSGVGRQNASVSSNQGIVSRMNQPGVRVLTAKEVEDLKKKGSLATGGYTGEWGSEGRLAMLHEKELVLNQNDTKNILDAVQMMRNSMMNGQAMQLGMYRTQYQQALSAISAQNAPLEQNVHIDATFPNVQNSNEIEEAFNNLINLASQRINSNLK